jgi:hypothetical protein
MADDIVFISSAQDVVEKLMKSIAGESKGLYILQSNVLSLPGNSSFTVCVRRNDASQDTGLRSVSALFQTPTLFLEGRSLKLLLFSPRNTKSV